MAFHYSVVNIVCNNFKHDSRVLKESSSLHKAGTTVTVAAIYDITLPETENVLGVSVYRPKLMLSRFSSNPLMRLFMLLEFLFTIAWKFRKTDIIHCNDLNALPIGVFIKIFVNRKARVVYDAHEYETERHSTPARLKPLLRKVEGWLLRRVDKVITVSDSIAQEYAHLYHIAKPALVLNCPPFSAVPRQDRFRQTLGIGPEQTIFLYQGGLTGGRGIEMLLDAFAQFESDRIVLVVMGYGELESQIKAAAAKSRTIFFHPAVAPDILLNYTASADYGISCIEDSCLSYRFCLPNKLFEYFMAGIPVVVSNLFEMKRLVETWGVGVVAEENTPQGFLDAIARIQTLDYAQLREKVDLARRHYHWENQEKTLVQLYSDLS